MKAASGELNLTVITIIAISAIVAIFWAFLPVIQNTINSQWKDIAEGDGKGRNRNISS